MADPGGGPPGGGRVGLALAGGAPGGAVYEIGALRALEEAVEGVDWNGLHVYVGVSAGAIIAACLANGLTPAQMCRSIASLEPGEHPFVPETFFTPAVGEIARRLVRVPALVARSLVSYARNRRNGLVAEALRHLGRALPVGVLDNEPIRAYFEKVFSLPGRSDDFRRLARRLVVVAADLDSGQAVRFGEPGWDHVPISRAIQASAALPGLYLPVEIEGRYYVDGILRKTLHASVALDAGSDLVFCVNPIVPVDTVRAAEEGAIEGPRLLDRGLPAVLAQSLRTMIHSRMAAGMAAYAGRYQADLVLLEPRRGDYRMFFTNIFGFADRRAVCEFAYDVTRRDLLDRYEELAPVLARHGASLRREVLEDEKRDLWAGVGLSSEDGGPDGLAVVARLDQALDRLERAVGEPEREPAPEPEAVATSAARDPGAARDHPGAARGYSTTADHAERSPLSKPSAKIRWASTAHSSKPVVPSLAAKKT